MYCGQVGDHKSKLTSINTSPCIKANAGAFVQKLQFVISFIFNPLRAKNDIHYDRGRDFVNGSGYFCTCLTANRLVCNKVIQILECKFWDYRSVNFEMFFGVFNSPKIRTKIISFSFSEHVESVHEGNKPFKCEVCDYRFS